MPMIDVANLSENELIKLISYKDTALLEFIDYKNKSEKFFEDVFTLVGINRIITIIDDTYPRSWVVMAFEKLVSIKHYNNVNVNPSFFKKLTRLEQTKLTYLFPSYLSCWENPDIDTIIDIIRYNSIEIVKYINPKYFSVSLVLSLISYNSYSIKYMDLEKDIIIGIMDPKYYNSFFIDYRFIKNKISPEEYFSYIKSILSTGVTKYDIMFSLIPKELPMEYRREIIQHFHHKLTDFTNIKSLLNEELIESIYQDINSDELACIVFNYTKNENIKTFLKLKFG